MRLSRLKLTFTGIAYLALNVASQASLVEVTATVEAGSGSNPTHFSGLLSGPGFLEKSDAGFDGEPSQITESQMIYPYFYSADAEVHVESNGKFHLNLAASSSASPLEGGGSAHASVSFHDQITFQPTIFSIYPPLSQLEDFKIHLNADFNVEGQTAGTGKLKVNGSLFDGDRAHSYSAGFNAPITYVKNSILFVGNIDLLIDASVLATGTGLNVVDFGNTITIGNLAVYDEDGNRIDGTFTSALGFTYSQAASQAVPEPGSLTLLGIAAFGLSAGAIRRRRQQGVKATL